ncbi:MAG: hypothetical protein K5893_06010 [Prevotella sp.]|nr:hypothetical protein [Prevotella sp.]
MKHLTSKKVVRLLLMVLTVMATLTACGPQSLSELVEQLNAECPHEADGMTVEGATLDANNVTVTYTIPKSTLPISMLNSVPGALESLKQEMLPELANKDFKDIAAMCIEENKGFAVVMQNEKGGDSFKLEFTPDDLKTVLK